MIPSQRIFSMAQTKFFSIFYAKTACCFIGVLRGLQCASQPDSLKTNKPPSVFIAKVHGQVYHFSHRFLAISSSSFPPLIPAVLLLLCCQPNHAFAVGTKGAFHSTLSIANPASHTSFPSRVLPLFLFLPHLPAYKPADCSQLDSVLAAAHMVRWQNGGYNWRWVVSVCFPVVPSLVASRWDILASCNSSRR